MSHKKTSPQPAVGKLKGLYSWNLLLEATCSSSDVFFSKCLLLISLSQLSALNSFATTKHCLGLGILITGPTSVGKSAVAQILAKKLDGRMINGDTMFFFKKYRIGTGLIDLVLSPEQMHLYQVLEPDAPFYDENQYVLEVDKIIVELNNRGATPIIEGSGVTYVTKLSTDLQSPIVKIGLKWPENFDVAFLIRKRIDGAVQAGLIAETKEIISSGLEFAPAFTKNPIYQATAKHIRGEITLEQMKEQITQDGLRISKWQYGQLKKLSGIVWVEADPWNPRVTFKRVNAIIPPQKSKATGVYSEN